MKVRVFVVLSSLATLSIGTVYLLFRDASEGSLAFEVAKSLLQVGVVAVAGAVISLLTFEYQRERQDSERSADIKRLSAEKERDLERAANEKQRDLALQSAEKERDLQRQAVEKQRDLERQAIEKQRDLEHKSVEYREGLLMSTLTATMNAYARTKKARRLLRARAKVQQAGVAIVLAEQYDLYLDWINDSQLEFENLARDIDTSAQAFTKPGFLKDQLHAMDSYLGTLIAEYEKERSRFSGERLSLPLAELPVLQDFLLQTDESKFKPSVVIPYHDVQQGLRQDLMHPSLASGTTKPSPSIERTATG